MPPTFAHRACRSQSPVDHLCQLEDTQGLNKGSIFLHQHQQDQFDHLLHNLSASRDHTSVLMAGALGVAGVAVLQQALMDLLMPHMVDQDYLH